MSAQIDWQQAESVLSQHPEVIAAWCFGSAQTGLIQPGSDLDLGILFERLPNLDQLLRLIADLQTALSFENIDLVPLNKADPILRFEAVSGRSIFCRDLARRAEFVSLTAREYEDAMAFFAWGLQMKAA